MDVQVIAQALADTLDPNKMHQAEAQLEQVHQAIQFMPCLLQVIMDGNYELQLRVSAAIYLKNDINKYWRKRRVEDPSATYVIPDEVKTIIRNNIIEAIIQLPEQISKQLCVSLEVIIKEDFPDQWPEIVTKCHAFLSSDNQGTWLGALKALYQLSKRYKYKKTDESAPYLTPMKQILPLLYNRMMAILPDQSPFSVTLQHWMLKIFHGTVHYSLPLELINESTLPGWIIVFQTIVDRPVPEEYVSKDDEDDDKANSEWWKCKKWCLHILCNMFERYGKPNNVDDDYKAFAEYYMKTFNCSTSGVINTLLKQLEKSRHNMYIAPRIHQLIFTYLHEAINYSAAWRLIRPHFQAIFESIIFPLLCHSEDDQALWESDPYEYIRMKFDIFEDLVSPAVAAQMFLTEACQKRKNVLDPVIVYCVQILNQDPSQRDPNKKDGALNVIGTTSDVLMKRMAYKEQLEPMLVAHVFPEFRSPFGYMRARACWMVHYFSEIQFKQESSLQMALQEVLNCLTQDKELPVKVEAAVALQFLLKYQPLTQNVIEPYVKAIIQELLVVIRETDNDDLTEVLQDLIETYSDSITDITVSLCSTLTESFTQLLDSSGGAEEDGYKALTALGLISTVQTLVKSAFKQPELLKQLETVLFNTMASILQNGYLDYYEEMLSLMDLFTAEVVTPGMWQMFGVIYDAFRRDGFDYFSEMMSVLYNYIRVGTDQFLSDNKYVEIIITMCKQVLTTEGVEDPQTYACKLLEVLLIECKGKIDNYILSIIECPLQRLTKQISDPDLRYSCILVVVAAIYYNAAYVMDILEKTQLQNDLELITAKSVD